MGVIFQFMFASFMVVTYTQYNYFDIDKPEAFLNVALSLSLSGKRENNLAAYYCAHMHT
ncbi:MAG: hypothetical protein ACI90V_008779 [Bacillariaceae sp.]|jgi:hypothetical protein